MLSLRSKKESTSHALTMVNSHKLQASHVQFDEMGAAAAEAMCEISQDGYMDVAVRMDVDTNDAMDDTTSCNTPKIVTSRGNTPLRLRGGAMPGLKDQGGSLHIINGNTFAHADKHATVIDKSKVAIDTFHLSCASDMFNPNLNYTGMVFYGTYALNGHRIRPGYIVMKHTDSATMQAVMCKNSDSHRALFECFAAKPLGDEMVEGFIFRNNKFTWNSATIHARPHLIFNDSSRSIDSSITDLLKNFLQMSWVDRHACTLPVSALLPEGRI